MKLNRRDCLKAGALTGAMASLSGCSEVIRRYTSPATPASFSLPPGDVEPTVRLVNRAAFGPTPNELKRVAAKGREAYVDEQLLANAGEPAGLQWRLHSLLETLQENSYDLMDHPESKVLEYLQQTAILWAVYSPNQLRERMVDFWSNHFNIYAHKGQEVYLQPTDVMQVIRENALGRFPDMLGASAKSPAMLCYLDNQVNKKGVANENYARELMELHSLGVHGGYTQKDVQEVARCLTGWTMETRPFWESRQIKARGTFRFDPDAHDNGEKRVLGHVIPAGGGEKDGNRVLDILANHPSTAKYISTKICRHFLGEETGMWPDRMAEVYLKTGGDIKIMLRPLLVSDELIKGPPMLKRPFDFMISSLRTLNADTDGGEGVQFHLARMGQPLYQWPMPDGYPDRMSSWTGSMLARWNYAAALASGAIGGTRVDIPGLVKAAGAESDAACADALTGLILGRRPDSKQVSTLDEKVRAFIAASPREKNQPVVSQAAALLLASPEFQWR